MTVGPEGHERIMAATTNKNQKDSFTDGMCGNYALRIKWNRVQYITMNKDNKWPISIFLRREGCYVFESIDDTMIELTNIM